MTWRFFVRCNNPIYLFMFINFVLTQADAEYKDCDIPTDCNSISEYCDHDTSKCDQCVNICLIDNKPRFQKCTEVCKNYLREKLGRRSDDIKTVHTLICVLIIVAVVILVLLSILLFLKIRCRKQINKNCSIGDEVMQMKKLQEIQACQNNGYVANNTSVNHPIKFVKGTSMQTMTTAISNIDEESRTYESPDSVEGRDNTHSRRRQTSSSTNKGGGSGRSYQSSSCYEPTRSTNRKPSEDRVPQHPVSSDNAAYDNLNFSSRSPTPTSSNQTLKGSSTNRTLPQSTRILSPDKGPNSARLPPIGQQPNGAPRASPYTISHSQVI